MNAATETVASEMSRKSRALATQPFPQLRIFRLNEYDFWVATSMEEAIEDAMKELRLERDDLLDDQFPAAPLTDDEIESFTGANTKRRPLNGWSLIKRWQDGGEAFPCQLLFM